MPPLDLAPARPDRALLDSRFEWMIYGAGDRGREAQVLLKANGFKVRGYIDRNAVGSAQTGGLPCHHPADLLPGVLRGVHVLVAVFNPYASLAPIHALLEEAEPERIVSYFDFHAAHASALGPKYWLTARDFYADKRLEIETAYALLADEASRAVYRASLDLRLRGDWQPLEALRAPEQYFCSDIPLPRQLHFVDGGAFRGDNWAAGAAAGFGFESVYAFEPDPVNFPKVSEKLRQLPAGTSTSLWPCGLWDTTTQLRFAGGTGSSSHFDEGGEQIVPVVALDDVLLAGPVNYVKMDIEGAECAALQGARGLIEREHPALAVCVYHEPEHLWSLALQIHFLPPGYDFYLRSHDFNGFEIVLYAVPQAKGGA